MLQLDKNIAMNLKRLRKARNMSLDMLSAKTGVSKSMLGQIERGESNPTVGTIGKIVEGMRISFDDLIQEPKSEVSIIQKETLHTSKYTGDDCNIYMFFPFDKKRGFESFVYEINPGGAYIADSRGENTAEYITVFGGELTLDIGGKSYQVSKGDAIYFSADKKHIYRNTSREKLVMNITFTWEKQEEVALYRNSPA